MRVSIDWSATFVAGIGLGVFGCGFGCGADQAAPKAVESGQSFTAAMTLVCNVDQYVQVTDDNLLEREQLRGDYLQDHVKNGDVIYHRTLWRVQDTQARAKTIRELSREAELSECPYADALLEEDL